MSFNDPTIRIRGRNETAEAARAASAQLEKLRAGAMRMAGALGIGFSTKMLVDFATASMKAADQVDNLSKMLNASVLSTQSLQVVAAEAGVEFGSITGAMARLENAQVEAIEGGEKQIAAFKTLGIQMGKLESMRPDELFEAVSIALNQNNLTASQLAAKYDLMGRSANRLNAVFATVAKDGLAGLNEGLEKSGEIMGENLVKKLDDLQARLDRFKRQASVTAAETTVGLVEGFSFFGAMVQEQVSRLFGGGSNMPMDEFRSMIAEEVFAGGPRALLKSDVRGKAAGSASTPSIETTGGTIDLNALLNNLGTAAGNAFRDSGLSDAFRGFIMANPMEPEFAAAGGGGGASVSGAASLVDLIQSGAVRRAEAIQKEQLSELKTIARAVASDGGGVFAA